MLVFVLVLALAERAAPARRAERWAQGSVHVRARTERMRGREAHHMPRFDPRNSSPAIERVDFLCSPST